MNNFSCYQEVIADLNERGYKNDFVLFGSDLLWIQQKVFIPGDDFSILECHQMAHPQGQMEDLVVLAVLAITSNIKGILLNHYSFNSKIPAVIISKLGRINT